MILVLGGTTEGRELAKELNQRGFPCILSVLTPLGKELAIEIGVKVIAGELNEPKLRELVSKEKIRFILDATHPYALQIKQTARVVAADLQIIYGRFEREQLKLPEDPDLLIVKNYDEALRILLAGQGGVLFTIGIKNLALFQPLWVEQHRPVWVKIYPETASLEMCCKYGISSEYIFAFHGSGNAEIIKGMFIATEAEWLITKESGVVGGTDIKIAIGLELKRKVLVIQRPAEEMLVRRFYHVENVLEYISNNLN